MRRSLVVLAALVALVAAIVATAPATLAGAALERVSNGTLALANADGTVWRGQATLTAARALKLPVVWSIVPWPLLRGELRVDVVAPAETSRAPRAVIVASRGAVALRELDMTIPADIVPALVPRSGIRTAGDVHVAATSLEWTPTTFAGGARIDWQDAQFAIAVDPAIRLGTVSAVLTAAGDRLTGPVTNTGGAFDVRGTLSLAASGAPNVAVSLTPRGGDPAQARSLTVATGPGGNWNVDYRAGSP